MPKKDIADLLGRKYGRLLVLGVSAHKEPLGSTCYACRCDCGTEFTSTRSSIVRGKRSCGCLRGAARKDPSEFFGKRFGRLTVLGENRSDPLKRTRFDCVCDCGNNCVASRKLLLRGETRSCGCLSRENAGKINFRHGSGGVGERRTKEYRAWAGMHTRCSNPKHKDWAIYGGKGIKVCDQWADFVVFLRDMGKAPTPQHSVDRVNSDRDYSPENCRWATPTEQRRNTSTLRRITHNGATAILTDWAEITGIGATCIAWRLRNGWSVGDALTTPSLAIDRHRRSARKQERE